MNRYPKLAAATLLALGLQASPGAAQEPGLDAEVQAAQPLVALSEDGVLIEAPTDVPLLAMNVRIFDEHGELVYRERTQGEPLMLMAMDLPDGGYRYEVVSVFERLAAPMDATGPGVEPWAISRSYGRFLVRHGLVVMEGPERDDASLIERVSGALLAATGRAMSLLVANAAAADVSISDATPTLTWNDTDNPSPTEFTNDVFSNADDTTGTWRLRDFIGANNGISIIRYDSTGNNLSSNSIHIAGDGDLSFANGGLFFERGEQQLSIGTTDTPGDLTISAGTPEFWMYNETDDNSSAMRMANDYWWFWTALSGGEWSNPFRVWLGAPNESLTIGEGGNIGMGTATATEALTVQRSQAAARFQLTSFTDTPEYAPQYIWRRARGSLAAPLALQANDNIGLFSFRGYTPAGFGGSRATITAQAAGDFTDASTPTRMVFATTPVGQTTPQQVLVINPNGTVSINGQQLNVPDYVFEEDYELMSLDKLRAFITENKHLPGVAPAAEVNENGLDIAGSQLSVLEKVEELTLYTLQQHDEIKALRAANSELRGELTALREHQAALQVQADRVERLETVVKLLVQERVGEPVLTAANRWLPR